MANFKQLSEYRNKILTRLLASQEICKAIKYADPSFLEQPDLAEPDELIDKNILPYLFAPDTSESGETYVSICFKKFQPINAALRSGLIYIGIFTHHALFPTDYGTTRIDYLLDKIDETLDKQHGFGLGKLELFEMDELTVNEKYSGAYLTYTTVGSR